MLQAPVGAVPPVGDVRRLVLGDSLRASALTSPGRRTSTSAAGGSSGRAKMRPCSAPVDIVLQRPDFHQIEEGWELLAINVITF